MGNSADTKAQFSEGGNPVERKKALKERKKLEKQEKSASKKQLKIDNKTEKERVKQAEKQRIQELKQQKIAAKNLKKKKGKKETFDGNGTVPVNNTGVEEVDDGGFPSTTGRLSVRKKLDHNGNGVIVYDNSAELDISEDPEAQGSTKMAYANGGLGRGDGALDVSGVGSGVLPGSDLDEVLAEARSRINSQVHGSSYSPHLASSTKDLPTAKYLEQKDGEHYLAGLLTEERKRCDQHRENYNTLKIEHRKLQTELLGLQDTVKRITEERSEMLEKHAKEIAQLENELSTLRQNNRALQSQVPGKDRVEALKSQMIADVEIPFRERLEHIERDNERLRGDNSKLKHDFTFLKSEYEHALSTHKSMLDDLKMQHEAEVGNLVRDKDELVRRLNQDTSGDMDRLHTLQRENASLNHRLKSLLAELDELRGQREKVGLESDHVHRLQTKQLSEFQANTRGLQMERDTLRKQCDHQAKEISTLMESQNELTKRLHEEEQKVSTMRNALDSAHHDSSLQITQAKLDSVKSVGAIERQRDSLQGQVEDLKSRLESIQAIMKQQESALMDKEREFADRISAVREEEFKKLSNINQDRQSLESRLQTSERVKVDIDEKYHRELLRYEQQLRESHAAKEQAEKELATLRGKLHNQTQLQSDIEYERSRSAEVRNQMMRFEAENHSLQSSENELNEIINQLRRNMGACNEEMRRVREKEVSMQNASDKVLAQHKSVWSDERTELKNRLDQVENQMTKLRENNTRESKDYNTKKQTYKRLIDKLRRKLEIAEAEKEQFRIQVESAKGYVPPEIVHGIKRELKDLRGKHREYKHIIQSGEVTHVPIGSRSFATASVHTTNFDISPDHTQELPEMASIMRRLAKLDRNQRKQMSELGLTSSPIVSPICADYSSDD